MSATQTEAIHRAVARYLAQVRAELSDLDGDLAAELTDGLERDLAESLQDIRRDSAGDDPDLVAWLGSPAVYAEELRRAAGMPPAVDGAVPAVPSAPARWRVTLDGWRGRPWWPRAARAAHELAPLWWLLRVWLLYQTLMWVIGEWAPFSRWPQDRDGMPNRWQYALVLAALLAGSVLVGLAARRGGAIRRISRVCTVSALVLAIPIGVFTYESRFYATGDVIYVDRQVAVQIPAEPVDGVYVDGIQVSNLFVYDSDGEPLSGVQIYDDRGRPVQTVSTSLDALQPSGLALPGVPEAWTFYPSQDSDGRNRWNVYPLNGAPDSEIDYSGDPQNGSFPLVEGAELHQPPSPFAKAPAVTQLTRD